MGAGGLGTPMLVYLAAAGVGTIGVVEDDTVDFSKPAAAGDPYDGIEGSDGRKSRSRSNCWRGLNPDVKVIPFKQPHIRRQPADIINGFDLVADGSDDFTTRFLLERCCYCGRRGLRGAVAIRCANSVQGPSRPPHPCYRCLSPKRSLDDVDFPLQQAGILGAIAGMVASLQATEVLWTGGNRQEPVGSCWCTTGSIRCEGQRRGAIRLRPLAPTSQHQGSAAFAESAAGCHAHGRIGVYDGMRPDGCGMSIRMRGAARYVHRATRPYVSRSVVATRFAQPPVSRDVGDHVSADEFGNVMGRMIRVLRLGACRRIMMKLLNRWLMSALAIVSPAGLGGLGEKRRKVRPRYDGHEETTGCRDTGTSGRQGQPVRQVPQLVSASGGAKRCPACGCRRRRKSSARLAFKTRSNWCRCQNITDDPVGRLLAVGEGLDVDDHLLAHVDPAFDRRRTHMGSSTTLSSAQQLRVHRRLMLEHIEAGAGNVAALRAVRVSASSSI